MIKLQTYSELLLHFNRYAWIHIQVLHIKKNLIFFIYMIGYQMVAEQNEIHTHFEKGDDSPKLKGRQVLECQIQLISNIPVCSYSPQSFSHKLFYIENS